MKRNKIILDEEFSGEAPVKKDFDRLRRDYDRKLRMKWIKRISAAAGVFALVILGRFFLLSAEKSHELRLTASDIAGPVPGSAQGAPEESRPERKIEPPFEKVDVPFEKRKIKAGMRQAFITEYGSVVEIPSGAFADSGMYELRYREFPQAAEILASGIPMEYDSAGQAYPFESAGMIELRAFDGEKELKLKKGKKIRIKLRSKRKEKDFSVYYFNEQEGKWEYRGKDAVKTLAERAPAEEVSVVAKADYLEDDFTQGFPVLSNSELIMKEKELLELLPPPRLRKADPAAFHFEYKVSQAEYPELHGYMNLQFEIPSGEKEVIKRISSIAWNKIELQRGFSISRYKAVFSNGEDKVTTSVIPVFTGNAPVNEKIYLQKHKAYVEKQGELRMEIDALRAKENDLETRPEEKKGKNKKAEEVIFRMFEIDGTGIWNIDRSVTWRAINAKAFRNEQPCGGEVLVVDAENNGVCRFYCISGKVKKMRVPASGRFYLIHLETGKRPAILHARDSGVRYGLQTDKLHFRELKEDIRYVADLKKILQGGNREQ